MDHPIRRATVRYQSPTSGPRSISPELPDVDEILDGGLNGNGPRGLRRGRRGGDPPLVPGAEDEEHEQHTDPTITHHTLPEEPTSHVHLPGSQGSTLHLTELRIGSEPPPRSVGIGPSSFTEDGPRASRSMTGLPSAGAPEDRVSGASIATSGAT
jgi:hypothetical protein